MNLLSNVITMITHHTPHPRVLCALIADVPMTAVVSFMGSERPKMGSRDEVFQRYKYDPS